MDTLTDVLGILHEKVVICKSSTPGATCPANMPVEQSLFLGTECLGLISPSLNERKTVMSGPPLERNSRNQLSSMSGLKQNLSGFATFISDVLGGFLEL